MVKNVLLYTAKIGMKPIMKVHENLDISTLDAYEHIYYIKLVWNTFENRTNHAAPPLSTATVKVSCSDPPAPEHFDIMSVSVMADNISSV